MAGRLAEVRPLRPDKRGPASGEAGARVDAVRLESSDRETTRPFAVNRRPNPAPEPGHLLRTGSSLYVGADFPKVNFAVCEQ